MAIGTWEPALSFPFLFHLVALAKNKSKAPHKPHRIFRVNLKQIDAKICSDKSNFAPVEIDDDGHEKIRLLRDQTPLINDDHIDVDCESIVFGTSNLNSGSGA